MLTKYEQAIQVIDTSSPNDSAQLMPRKDYVQFFKFKLDYLNKKSVEQPDSRETKKKPSKVSAVDESKLEIAALLKDCTTRQIVQVVTNSLLVEGTSLLRKRDSSEDITNARNLVLFVFEKV